MGWVFFFPSGGSWGFSLVDAGRVGRVSPPMFWFAQRAAGVLGNLTPETKSVETEIGKTRELNALIWPLLRFR